MTLEAASLAAAERVIERTAPAMLGRFSSLTQVAAENMKLRLGEAFQDHIASTYRKISRLKTLTSKDNPVNLVDIYVNLRLRSGEDQFLDASIIEDRNCYHRLFLYGTGGAGKSMLLRWIALRFINDPLGLIPVFVELRDIVFDGVTDFEDLVFNYISRQGNSESVRLYKKAIDEGLVIFFLDGFDEIPINQRTPAFHSISSFSLRRPNVSIVLSSRPGPSDFHFQEFRGFEIQPLNKAQAIEVVKKTEADEDLKQSFIKKLDGELFDKHDTFLGVPLLVVMMLLTYSSYSEIPERMSVFYEQAFTTLYSLHDTVSKGPFKREHFAKLTPDQFGRAFEAFCFLTLSREKYDFLRHEIEIYINNALKITQIGATPEPYLRDLEESVCLVRQEGVKYLFAHRSFQEYFAAKFALRYDGDKQFEVIDKCLGSGWEHNTLSLMNEIDPIKLRERWILPALTQLDKLLEEMKGLPVEEVLEEFFSGWRFEKIADASSSIESLSIGYFLVRDSSTARRLSYLLEAVTKLPEFYDVADGEALLPANLQQFALYAAELSKQPRDFLALHNLLAAGEVGDTTQVDLEPKNREWLEKAGLLQRIEDYRQKVRQELIDTKLRVEQQQELELELL